MVAISKAGLKSKRELIRRTYTESEQPATVAELCDQYLQLDALDGVVWAWAGDSLADLGRFDEARVALQTARGLVSTADHLAFVLDCQSELARAIGDYKQAERFVREAVEILPASDRLWVRLGCILFDQARLAEAEDCFRRAVELDGRFMAGALYELGRLLRARGEFFEARRLLKAAIKGTNDERPRLVLADVERVMRLRSRGSSK